MHMLSQTYFCQSLNKGRVHEVWSYLRERGFSQEIIDQFALGWSPQTWQGLLSWLQKYGYPPEQGVEAGLLSKNAKGNIYDRFRGRLIFPIYDLSGRVIAFGGRILGEGDPKYLNSSDTPIFKKGDILFGLYQARKHLTQRKEAILTEGYADVLSLVQNGYVQSCGVLGTSLTPKQIQRLSGFVRQITLIFDGDRAGRQAAFRSADMILRYGLQVRVVSLPEGYDVDDILQQQGPLKLDEYIEQAQEGLTFCLKMLPLNESPKKVMDWTKDFLAGLRDTSWKAYYLPRIARGLDISEQELRQELHKNQLTGPSAAVPLGHSSTPAHRDRELLRFAVSHPEYVNELTSFGMADALTTDRGKAFWAKLVRYGHRDVLPYLDAGEKAFFVETEMSQDGQHLHSQVLWEDIRCFLQQLHQHKEQRSLQQSLKKAQDSGDSQEVTRLLQKFNMLVKGRE
jgi:DNA primase